jgi:NhaA family Na+:H+ antiporter
MSGKRESFITEFFRLESASGIMLMFAAVAALIVANSPLAPWYGLLFDVPVEVRVGKLEIAKPLLLWVNDGMMAVFFFLVGLELKRELVEGELSELRNVILPGLGALGGMVVPAAVYLAYNWNDPVAVKGWAIPTATDIAFALGILALLGSRVPVALKLFLTSMAIFDDIGAILVIALFYTNNLSLTALVVAGLCLPALFYLNRSGVMERSVYLVLGVIMWVAMLKSGIHATLSGVILAMFIPISSKLDPEISPLKELEHDLHILVAFFILPLFAFANAGIDLSGIGIETLIHPVPVGIALGLFLGKQAGVFAFCWLGIKLKIARLPEDMTILSLYGIGILSGVGFTMSLFIGSLAFEETGVNLLFDERLGILLGSGASGIMGYLILRFSLRTRHQPD